MSIDRFNHKVDRKVETKPAPLRRIEVITGVERRRTWSLEEKRAILTESFADGVVISEVARRHGLRPQQLFTWRSEFRKRGLACLSSRCASLEAPAFAPVMLAGPDREAALRGDFPALAASAGGPPAEGLAGAVAAIEIVLDAATVRLHGAIDGGVLATVLRALKAAS
jgi:transposase